MPYHAESIGEAKMSEQCQKRRVFDGMIEGVDIEIKKKKGVELALRGSN